MSSPEADATPFKITGPVEHFIACHNDGGKFLTILPGRDKIDADWDVIEKIAKEVQQREPTGLIEMHELLALTAWLARQDALSCRQ